MSEAFAENAIIQLCGQTGQDQEQLATALIAETRRRTQGKYLTSSFGSLGQAPTPPPTSCAMPKKC
jgi:hypothetical protein